MSNSVHGMYSPYESYPNRNKYQEPQMLFFKDKRKARDAASYKDLSRPRTIQEIKKLQKFVSSYKTEEGKSLNQSIKKLARKDESFNEFLKNFKAKNEQGWANIIDLT